ncbi:hypothetical protein PsYK624_011090 [Phanerochaete sordida]|uniref:Uncharacterized protein n=1 Tax=Phanerochaete sordida TaxID=48140 RepID=A0A9P3L8U1_9APHY|nr:hypothetical protein PsYK624_011090 [Phanerochaete sordida]
MTLVRPFMPMPCEPIVAFWTVYRALVYGVVYIFLESFRVVVIEKQSFSLGEDGLAPLGLFSGAVITYASFSYVCTRPHGCEHRGRAIVGSGDRSNASRGPTAPVTTSGSAAQAGPGGGARRGQR